MLLPSWIIPLMKLALVCLQIKAQFLNIQCPSESGLSFLLHFLPLSAMTPMFQLCMFVPKTCCRLCLCRNSARSLQSPVTYCAHHMYIAQYIAQATKSCILYCNL